MSAGVRTEAVAPGQAPFGAAAPRLTAVKHPLSRFPELDCVRGSLAAAAVAAAEERAARVGVGADQVLIASGALDEESYLRALAEATGTSFEPLTGTPRAQCPIEDDRLIEAAAGGLLPLTIDDALHIVLAPRGTAARRIVELVAENPAWGQRFRFTSAAHLDNFILRCAGEALTARACEQLKTNTPAFSAAAPRRRSSLVPVVMLAALVLGAVVAPAVTALTVEVLLATVFLAWLGLRLTGAVIARPPPAPLTFTADKDLPVYTLIAALYHEAASVAGLLRAIERLDYPAEKLDVILAVEADDHETRTAIDRCRKRLPITVVPVPAAEPRTKPKALNVALPFARGAFTVIYDAEDRPEPDQLRRALQAFRASGGDLACVQARLCIDNTADSWLTRLFTAEYAAQFDVFLDGLTRLKLPLPLGGSSNHFHTATLREVGAWDPYNVTEDADLGMRLARFGYRAEMIDSTTYEEAPARFGPWLRQRTRWFKGWMQTWAVHMRQPRRLMRELGLAGFVAFQLVVGGNVLAALVHPLFLAGLVVTAARGLPLWSDDNVAMVLLAALYGGSALVGYFTSALLGLLGLKRRGLPSTAWVLLLTPLNWLLLSLAAWRAVYQLTVAPYTWEKTEHGLAKSSRRADNRTRSLLALERQLSALNAAGNLVALPDEARRLRRYRQT